VVVNWGLDTNKNYVLSALWLAVPHYGEKEMTEQESFEKWASVDDSVSRNIEKRSNGTYKTLCVQENWSAWQACAALKDARINELEAELEVEETRFNGLTDQISELAAQNEVLRNALKMLHDLECEDLRSPDDEDVSYELRYAKEALAMTDTGAEILRKRDAQVLRKAADYFIEKYALSGDAMEHHAVVELDELADKLEKGE